MTVGAAVGASATDHEAAFGQVGPEPDELAHHPAPAGERCVTADGLQPHSFIDDVLGDDLDVWWAVGIGLLVAEQAALLDARASGAYRSATINRAQHLLDISAARFEPESGH